MSLGDTAIDSRAVEVPPPERSTTLTLAVRSHECNVVLRFLAGYPIRPRRRYRYRGLRLVIAPPQARLHVSRAPPEGLDWSSTREGFSRRAIGRPPQAFEPAPNKQGGPASQPEPLSCVGRGGAAGTALREGRPPLVAPDHADKSAKRWSLCDSVGRSRMPTCEGKCPNLPPLGGTRLDGGG